MTPSWKLLRFAFFAPAQFPLKKCFKKKKKKRKKEKITACFKNAFPCVFSTALSYVYMS